MSSNFYVGLPGPQAIDLLNRLWDRVAGVYTLTDAATIHVDITHDERVYEVTLGGNRTFVLEGAGGVALGSSSLALYNGKLILLRIKQDATGGRTGTFSTGFNFGTSFASVTLSTAANKVDYIGIVYDHARSKCDVVSYALGF